MNNSTEEMTLLKHPEWFEQMLQTAIEDEKFFSGFGISFNFLTTNSDTGVA